MSKIRSYIVAVVCLVAVMGFTKGFQKPEREVKLFPSYPGTYRTEDDLVRQSDLVVVGVVSDRIDTGFVDNSSIPYTDFNFTVTRVLKGNPEGNKIVIRQTGGTSAGQKVEVSRDPLFNRSEQSLLFLHRWDTGKYYVVGGHHGRFPITSKGQISSLNPYVKVSGDATQFIDGLETRLKDRD